MYRRNKLQLIDLDTSSEDEEMGGVMVSRRIIQSRLGWLNTIAEPQMEQKTKADMEIEIVQEKYKEDRVQDKDDDQQNEESTEPPEVTRSTEKEYVEKRRRRGKCVGNPCSCVCHGNSKGGKKRNR